MCTHRHTYIHTGRHTTCAHTRVQAHSHTPLCSHWKALVRVLVAIPQSVCCVLILRGPGIRGILFLKEDARLVFSDHERTPIVAPNLAVA